MEAPGRYSVSPWYSLVTVTTPQHVPSLTESLRLIWGWLRGVQPNWREAAREERVIEALAAEMEAEPETNPVRQNTSETRSGETRSVSSHRREESHGLRQR